MRRYTKNTLDVTRLPPTLRLTDIAEMQLLPFNLKALQRLAKNGEIPAEQTGRIWVVPTQKLLRMYHVID